jgi:hypothetical protein
MAGGSPARARAHEHLCSAAAHDNTRTQKVGQMDEWADGRVGTRLPRRPDGRTKTQRLAGRRGDRQTGGRKPHPHTGRRWRAPTRCTSRWTCRLTWRRSRRIRGGTACTRQCYLACLLCRLSEMLQPGGGQHAVQGPSGLETGRLGSASAVCLSGLETGHLGSAIALARKQMPGNSGHQPACQLVTPSSTYLTLPVDKCPAFFQPSVCQSARPSI